MVDSVVLAFKATSSTFLSTYNKEWPTAPAMIYRLEHEFLQKVTTASGIDLTPINWALQVSSASEYNEEAGKQNALGFLACTSAQEGCLVSIAIGESTFGRLIEAGHLPSRISVSVTGLQYGEDYDGNQKIWSDTKIPCSVTDINFEIPLHEADETTAIVQAISLDKLFEVIRQARNMLYVIAATSTLICIKLCFG